MEKIGLGVIGTGLWGESIAQIFASHPNAELVAVCDMVGDRAKATADRFGAKRHYVDYQDLLSDKEIAAVGIATPDFAHRDVFVAACEAGKSILVEKPLATTDEDLRAMNTAFQKSGVRVMVDFHARWNPPLAIAREDIVQGNIGQIISMYYRLNDTIYVPTEMLKWAAKSSILWFLGSHTVDTLRFMSSDEVKRVYAVSQRGTLDRLGVNVPDLYQAVLEFSRGAVATIENHWIIPNSFPNWNDIKLNILGTDGMYNMDLTENQTSCRYTAKSSSHPDILVKPLIHGKPMGFAHESIRDFVDRLVDGRDFVVGFDDGYRVSKVILSIMDSAETRQPVEVHYNG